MVDGEAEERKREGETYRNGRLAQEGKRVDYRHKEPKVRVLGDDCLFQKDVWASARSSNRLAFIWMKEKGV